MADWFEVVSAETRITQGDVILDCPLLSWKVNTFGNEADPVGLDFLEKSAGGILADVVVLTQACDLEQNKVKDVVVCSHVGLRSYRKSWEQAAKDAGHNPTAKAWKRTCQDIANGYVWNQTFLSSHESGGISMELRVVNFHRVFTIPRNFVEVFLRKQNQSRLRLLSPYREHLSQAFARFFMRVGLPQPIEGEW